MSKQLKYPRCAALIPLPPTLPDGVLTCPSCQGKFRVKDRPASPPAREELPPREVEPEPAAAETDQPAREERPKKRKKKRREQKPGLPQNLMIGAGAVGGILFLSLLGWLIFGKGGGSSGPSATPAGFVVIDAPVPPLPPREREVASPVPPLQPRQGEVARPVRSGRREPVEATATPLIGTPPVWEIKPDVAPPSSPLLADFTLN